MAYAISVTHRKTGIRTKKGIFPTKYSAQEYLRDLKSGNNLSKLPYKNYRIVKLKTKFK